MAQGSPVDAGKGLGWPELKMLSSMANNLAKNKTKTMGRFIWYWIDANSENKG
jgi:hypothetical protein